LGASTEIKVGREILGVKSEFKAAFKAEYQVASEKAIESSYTVSTKSFVEIPPNRTSVIHQMVFEQRTTLPYTAKIRVVPRLRFHNGFTKWGGGKSYTVNPNTSAVKDEYKGKKSRLHWNFEFRRIDEIREEARENGSHWFVS
jgi:hypothetical protein